MYKKLLIFVLALISSYSLYGNNLARSEDRITDDISRGWRFERADVAGADSRDFQGDRKWQSVDLPHTWNTKDIFDDVPGYHRGIGWYRKEITIPKDWAGKRIIIRFEAACMVATVWVNGELLGQHKGSWLPFEFDITDLVKPGTKDNLVAVRVDNRFRRDVLPHHIDFNFMGGLHREVYLIATDPTYIVSTSVTTPKVSLTEGVVALETEICNEAKKPKQCTVVSTITGPGLAKPVTLVSHAIELKPGEKTIVKQESKPIANPKLWSPDEPNLYEVTSQLLVDSKPADSVKSPLGFRWYRFDPDKGFFLNGKHLKLRGVNRHDDYPGLGWALPQSRQIKDMELIKELGANFVRTAHYAQHPVVLDTCDKIGLLVWEEIPFDGEGPHLAPTLDAKDLAKNLKKRLHDMILRDRNHPSIIIWSLGNENMQGSKFEERKAVADLTKELDKLCKKWDPTRPTGVAINKPYRSKPAGLNDAVDILGYNIYEGWYGRTIEDFARKVDAFHEENPSKPIVITEYGAGIEKGLHTETPERQDFSEEHGCRFHEFYLKEIEKRPFIAGSLQWNVFDFAVELRTHKKTKQTIDHMNQKGIFTYDRKPKDIYYLYRSRWTDDPIVYIVSHTWTKREAGAKPIKVYSNCDVLELFHNGKSLGKKTKAETDGIFVWDVTLVKGVNKLKATGVKDGKEFVDAMEVEGT